jgi:uncharacterized protein (DUF58 family)
MRSTGSRRFDAMTRAAAAIALGGALLLSAAVFDSPSLYVSGVALCALGGGALAWVTLAAAGAAVERRAGPPTVVEDEPWPLRVELRGGLLPPPGGAVLDPLLEEPVRVGPLGPSSVRVDVRFGRRGRRTLPPAALELRDPLALCVRRVTGTNVAAVLVLPRVEHVRAAAGGGAGVGGTGLGGAGAGPAQLGLQAASEVEVDGLRPYRDGAPATRIHWPAVARTGEMVERRLVADADSAPLVLLDAARPASEEALDSAVRAAASLVFHLAHVGGCGVLLPGDRRPIQVTPDLGAWPALHARLAVVEAGGRSSLARAARGGAVFWVTGAAGAVPAPLARLATGPRWLVAATPPRGYRAGFTVAGCVGVRLDRATRAPAARGRRSAA